MASASAVPDSKSPPSSDEEAQDLGQYQHQQQQRQQGLFRGETEEEKRKDVEVEKEEKEDEQEEEAALAVVSKHSVRPPLRISYTIEDLDAPDHSRHPKEGVCRSFFSPKAALRDLRLQASRGAEIRWELQGPQPDPEHLSRDYCAPWEPSPSKNNQDGQWHEEQHNIETDRWSLRRPDYNDRPEREPRRDLDLLVVPPNSRQHCICPPAQKDGHASSKSRPASWALGPQLSLPSSRQESRRAVESKSRSLRERSRASSKPEARWPRRESRRLGDIAWDPILEKSRLSHSDFSCVTPTRLPPPPPPTPPPASSSVVGSVRDPEEELRWRLLSQVTAFPIYQGAWREASPPLWSPREESLPAPSLPAAAPPPVAPAATRPRNAEQPPRPTRAKSEEGPPSNESRPRRPQLMRSRALLEVPHREPGKRSLSEEMHAWGDSNASDRRATVFRAKSEEVGRNEEVRAQELREYVTTV